MDSELRRLSRGLVRPGLSLGFMRALRTRLAIEKHDRRESKRRLLIMQIYWILAAVASIAVLLLVRWPDTLPPVPAAYIACVLLFAILISPLLMLLHHRFSLQELVTSTLSVNLAPHDKKMEVRESASGKK